MSSWQIVLITLIYLCILFAVAYFAEYMSRSGKSIVKNVHVYSLSLAVYCTAWTYYGSVGRAVNHGLDFLTIYLGPTVVCFLFWPLYRKILVICKSQRIVSIADFISQRYGKDGSLSIMVTLLFTVGVIPYIALQLKAITVSIDVLQGHTGDMELNQLTSVSNIIIVVILNIFIVLFGARSIDSSEKHEGLVAAIAFESIVKLIAFSAVGIFVTYGIFDGFDDLFQRAMSDEKISKMLLISPDNNYSTWTGLVILSMLAFVLLPRQFQVGVVENEKESHLFHASWSFPLYLILINVFVLPIAIAGMLTFSPGTVDADTYVLALPLFHNQQFLSITTFVGGFSAATSMIIVETIALSTMISNNLITPFLLKVSNETMSNQNNQWSTRILYIRRASIVLIIVLALLYDVFFAKFFALVSIGLISFAAVAQFAPAFLLGMFWKGASKWGALTGITLGFLVWAYTLVLPTVFMTSPIITEGLFGLSWLRPQCLLNLEGLDPITHSLYWSLFLNTSSFIIVSIFSRLSAKEIYYSDVFVNIYNYQGANNVQTAWKGIAKIQDLKRLLANFLGVQRSEKIIESYVIRNKINQEDHNADPRLVTFVERVLSGVIGSTSSRIMVSSVTNEEELNRDEVINMLRESQQIMDLNKELRRKSAELLKATNALKEANEQMKVMDVIKDEFLYTVTHELRTPITSVRAMAEIVHDHDDMEEEEKQKFLASIIKETERLTHLITQVLNLERYESGNQKMNITSTDITTLIDEALETVQPLVNEKNIHIVKNIPDSMMLLRCDRDMILQVFNNLLSNAIKHVEPQSGEILISVLLFYDEYQIHVSDNGKGIPKESIEFIFDKFFQAKNQTLKKPVGSGLGLAITKRIIEMHGGKIWVESKLNSGSNFIFTLPGS